MEEELALDTSPPVPLQEQVLEQRVDPRQSEYSPLITDRQVPPGYGQGMPAGPRAAPAPTPVLPERPAQQTQPTPNQLRVTPQAPSQVPTVQPSTQDESMPALRTDAPLPPRLTPGVTGRSPLEADEPDEVSDARRRQREVKGYGTVRSHRDPREVIAEVPKPRIEEHPNYSTLVEMQNALYDKNNPMTTKEFKDRRAIFDRELNRMRHEQEVVSSQKHREQREKDKLELHGIDQKWQSIKQRDETSTDIQTHITKSITAYELDKKGEDLKKAKAADIKLTMSPLATMKDGLHEVVMSIASMNPTLTTAQAMRYALAMGSPVGTDYAGADGEPDKPSVNGVRGKGARFYDVVGRDVTGALFVQMPDHEIIRVKPGVLDTLNEAHDLGWAAMKKWEADRAAQKNKQGWVDQGYEYFFGKPQKAK